MLPLAKARKLAQRIVDELRPHCARIEIAGSIRRGRPEVGAVDLVIEPTNRAAIEARVGQRCKFEKNGQQNLVATTREGGVQLDLWFAQSPKAQSDLFASPDRPADNFGSLLLCRTGSTEHNMALAERAKRMGLHWNPHWGVYHGGVLIASATEADVYRALQLDFIEPADREFSRRNDQQRLIYGGPVSV